MNIDKMLFLSRWIFINDLKKNNYKILINISISKLTRFLNWIIVHCILYINLVLMYKRLDHNIKWNIYKEKIMRDSSIVFCHCDNYFL